MVMMMMMIDAVRLLKFFVPLLLLSSQQPSGLPLCPIKQRWSNDHVDQGRNDDTDWDGAIIDCNDNIDDDKNDRMMVMMTTTMAMT